MKSLKKHVYRVTADTKKGRVRTWAIDVRADSQKEAIDKAKREWKLEMHLFGAKAERRDEEGIEFEFWKNTYECRIIDGRIARVWKGE